MKFTLFISILNIFSALSLSLKNTAKTKLSKRIYSIKNRQNYDNDESSTNSLSIQKSIISALISFQILSLSQTNGLQFIEPTNAASDNLISINTEVLDSKVKEIQNALASITPNTEGLSAESKSILDSLQNSLNDIKTKLPTITLNTDAFKVKYRNKQFYVDFDLPSLPSNLDTPIGIGSDVQIQNEIIKSMNALIDKKPLLTTTVQSSDSYISQLPTKTPYYKQLMQSLNDRLMNPEHIRLLQDFVSTTLPQFITTSLTDFKYLIPLSLILVIVSDIIQSRDQYKRLHEVNDNEIKSLQATIQSQINNIDQLKFQLQSKDNEILSIQEFIRIEKENIKKQEILKLEQEKKALLDKQNFEKMQKIKLDQDAIQLAIKGKDMFLNSITALIKEYDNKNMDLPNFETLMTKPVIDTEEKLVLEIKHKKLSDSDTKELIEKVAKQLNGLIVNEMQSVETLINNAKSKREYEKKRESELNERMNKIKGVGVTTITSPSSSVSVVIPSKAEMDNLITDLIHVADENIVHDEEAERIAEIEAKDRVELENEHKAQVIQQKEDEARAEYENKLMIEREKRLKLLKQPPPGTVTMTAPSPSPVTVAVTRSEAKQSTPAASTTSTMAEDAEIVAEAEAIMRLEEEALMKIRSDSVDGKNKDIAKGIKLTTKTIAPAVTSSLKPKTKINIKKTKAEPTSGLSTETTTALTTADITTGSSNKKLPGGTKSVKKSIPATSKTAADTVTKSVVPVAVIKDSVVSNSANNLIATLKALTPSQLRRRTRSQLESDISVLKSLRPAISSDKSAAPIDELNKEALAGIIETYIKNILSVSSVIK